MPPPVSRLRTPLRRAVLFLGTALLLWLGAPSLSALAQPLPAPPLPEATVSPVPMGADLAPLPPLDVVLAAARSYSPRLRMEAAAVTQASANLRGSRALWLQGITVGASTNYGSTGNATLDEVTIGTQTTIGVRLSLYDLFGRRHDMRAQEARITQAREQEQMVEIEEDRFVTQLYHEVALAERLVGVRSEALQAARSHYAVAERAFSQGHLSVADLAQVTQTKASAEATYESASAEYRNAYAQLELVVGTSLRALAEEPVVVKRGRTDAQEHGGGQERGSQEHDGEQEPGDQSGESADARHGESVPTAAPRHRDTATPAEDGR
ncbi:MAG: TolC family protein [Bacteroidota bacterium]